MNSDNYPKTQEKNLEELNYPAQEDIFNQEPHISLDGDGIPETDDALKDELNLDVPGADLDDAQQNIGSEDEENNYWSLGGENHEDLETPEDIN